jgi:hypothetical protein
MIPYVISYQCFISTHGGHKVPSRPVVVPNEVLTASEVCSGDVNDTLFFDESENLRYRVFRGNGQHHVDVVHHEMAFFDPGLFLLSEPSEHWPEMLSQNRKQALYTVFRNKNHRIFTRPS